MMSRANESAAPTVTPTIHSGSASTHTVAHVLMVVCALALLWFGSGLVTNLSAPATAPQVLTGPGHR